MSWLDAVRRALHSLSGDATSQGSTPMTNYAGRWITTFGPMELTQQGDRVEGSYDFRGIHCTLSGQLQDGRLVFTYHEPTISGEGWFEQRRSGRFAGQWRQQGETERWFPWEGSRPFDGIWDSSFGPLRLLQDGDHVIGSYEGAGHSTVEGRVDGDRLTFRYQEPKARGEGWFELAQGGELFHGQWRPEGGPQWGEWQGRRMHAMPGHVWLVVLESYWQRSLAERDFSFGSMLAAIFARLPHVGTRQRFFDDADSLERWLRDITYLPEPVAIVLAAHGSEEGLTVRGEPVDPRSIVRSLRLADNVLLLHFSACLMLHEGKSGELARTLQRELGIPISGYNTSVDWAASAFIEFHLLDMVLGRGISPEEAGQQLERLVRYSGDQAPPGSPYRAAGFRMLLPASGG